MRLKIIILLVLANVCRGQTKDFAVTKNQDTIFLTIEKMRNSVKMYGQKDGKPVIYKAKNLISFNCEGSVYESIKIGGLFKRWMFAYKKTSGDLNLYVFSKQRQNLHSKNNRRDGNIVDLITDQKPGPADPGYSNVERLYLRKQIEERGTVHKLGLGWRKTIKKLCADCSLVLTELSTHKNDFNPDKLVGIYNDKCGTKK